LYELAKLGIKFQKIDSGAVMKVPQKLHGGEVLANDIRAAGASVFAGLIASGVTYIKQYFHLKRGYDSLELKLSSLGPKILSENLVEFVF
jgi:UDP-N-acetylglucosamine 1-carboxyvinyltransferase